MRFVLRSDRHLADLRAALPGLLADLPSARVVTANLHPEHKAVLEGDTEVPLTEQTLLPMRVGDVTLLLGPRSFFQTNTTVAAPSTGRPATGSTPPTRRPCGTSTAAWAGSRCTRRRPGRTVVGVETSADAVDAAPGGGAAARGCRGAGIRAHLRRWATRPRPDLSPAPDLVVVNPPRRGIGPDLAGLARRVARDATSLYSSCNVDSLARDLAAMPSLRAGRRPASSTCSRRRRTPR